MAKNTEKYGVNYVLMPISKLKKNPENPRIIKDSAFFKLVESIKNFPEMLEIRPIVVNADMMILGGNMRFEACRSAGLSEVPVIVADHFTPEQQREFIIKDNVSGGEWDWEDLAQNWDTEELLSWGLDVPEVRDYSDKNEEIDIDSMDEKMTIKLTYTEEEYWEVKKQLSQIATTPEQAIWKLLGNE